MAYVPTGNKKKEAETTEMLVGIISGIAKFIMWVGLLASLVGAGFLIYYFVRYSGSPPAGAPDPKDLIETFRKILTTGLLAFFIGSAYLFWGEGWMEMIQIIVSVIFFLAPSLGPIAVPSAATSTTGIPMLALVA